MGLRWQFANRFLGTWVQLGKPKLFIEFNGYNSKIRHAHYEIKELIKASHKFTTLQIEAQLVHYTRLGKQKEG